MVVCKVRAKQLARGKKLSVSKYLLNIILVGYNFFKPFLINICFNKSKSKLESLYFFSFLNDTTN